MLDSNFILQIFYKILFFYKNINLMVNNIFIIDIFNFYIEYRIYCIIILYRINIFIIKIF